MWRVVGAAREGIVLKRAASVFQPGLKTGASRFEQLELDRPARLLLRDSGSRPHPAAADKLTDSDLHDVAAAQLAVDGEVEERAVAEVSFPVEPESDGPNLLRLERALRTDHASGVPGPPLRDRRVEL